MKTIGLIVNPISGMGGRVGLKGTDGVAAEAARRGAIRQAGSRAAAALQELLPVRDDVCFLCAGGEMGAGLVHELGFPNIQVVYWFEGESTAEDTICAACAMRDADLLMFAGGDGTARDVYQAVGENITAIGIPAGVKIHSPVYAIRPEAAGKLALKYLKGNCRYTREAEVLDIDETAYRNGRVNTNLYGYLQTPDDRDYMQHGKAPSPLSEHAEQCSIAYEMADQMKPDTNYLIGPGSTTRTLMELLGLPDTLLGVDLIRNGKLVQVDLGETDILQHMTKKPTHLIVTPTGGQGYLFGRGNQQLSPTVLRQIGKDRLHILATREKILRLYGRPLLLDTGDENIDRMLSGYVRIIVGYREEEIYRLSAD